MKEKGTHQWAFNEQCISNAFDKLLNILEGLGDQVKLKIQTIYTINSLYKSMSGLK